MVLFGLFRVGLREGGDRLIEAVALAEIAGNGDPVVAKAGSGVDSYAQIGNGGQGE